MSDPNLKGQHVVMVLDVNLIRPTPHELSKFWGRIDNGLLQFHPKD
jgi:hypothetical protein